MAPRGRIIPAHPLRTSCATAFPFRALLSCRPGSKHRSTRKSTHRSILSQPLRMSSPPSSAVPLAIPFPADVRPLTLAAAPGASAPSGVDPGALRVAYQGVPGAYSEMAAKKAYPACTPVPCSQFDDAFLAVEQWLVDRAVLPIENSLGGSIHRNYDLLLRHRLHIVGEVQLPVHHCLLALPGSSVSSLTRVMSHPQALAQCEMTLSRLGSMVREAVDDTAGAAKMVARDRLEGVGAVASLRAAEIYGLDVLAQGIQDDSDNITRFLVLAREPILPTNNLPFKTSIVFTLDEGPGVLFKALSAFALRDINLTKIESRPQRDKPLLQPSDPASQLGQGKEQDATGGALDPTTALFLDGVITNSNGNGNGNSNRNSNGSGERSLRGVPEAVGGPSGGLVYKTFDYLFYIDFQASLAERNAQNALRHLQEFAPFLRVLGSYPMDVRPL